jgi:hypothetical protein
VSGFLPSTCNALKKWFNFIEIGSWTSGALNEFDLKVLKSPSDGRLHNLKKLSTLSLLLSSVSSMILRYENVL